MGVTTPRITENTYEVERSFIWAKDWLNFRIFTNPNFYEAYGIMRTFLQ